ncbi:MAG: hypothetical protein HY042_06130 [Spirochaetia bacterium]|nr:hypothetical protein [Spirochaetia bacterium]
MRQAVIVLVVEPRAEALMETQRALSGSGLEVRGATNAAEALMQPPDNVGVIVADIDAADSGRSLLNALETWFPDAAVIGCAHRPLPPGSNERFFDVMQKPVPAASLLANVLKAAEFARELRETRALEKMEKEQFRNRLEWLLWKRTRDTRQMIDYGLQLVTNLRHAIAQGEGVGNLVTQAEFVPLLPQTDDGKRLLPENMVTSMTNSAKAVRAWLQSLERFGSIDSARYPRETLDAAGVSAALERALQAVEKFRRVGNQTVAVDPVGFKGAIACNTEAIEMTLRELLTNAFKYSPPGSTISVFELRGGASVSLAVINDERPDMKNIELSTEAFMPFARTNNVYHDDFLDEELSLGIGLPVIQDAMQQNGGAIFLKEIRDHSEGAPKTRVLAEVILGPRVNTRSE